MKYQYLIRPGDNSSGDWKSNHHYNRLPDLRPLGQSSQSSQSSSSLHCGPRSTTGRGNFAVPAARPSAGTRRPGAFAGAPLDQAP